MTKTLAFTTIIGPALALALSFGCGGGGGGRASVTAGPMPEGGTFTGVWFSPQYGEMHMQQQGSGVVGRYEKDERSGRIQGTVQGDLMRFEWTERRELVGGRPSNTRGRGVFQYRIGDDDRHNLLGQWGLDDNETGGGDWNAYKLQNRRPEVDTSVGGDTGSDVEDWDDSGGGDDDMDDSGGGDSGGGDSGGGDDDLGDDDGLGDLDL